MLSLDEYRYLNDVLRTRLTVKPAIAPYPLDDGHVPTHAHCHVTAVHLETTQGLGAQIGIQWLNKSERLLPWPHVINWVGSELVDFSHPVLEPKLAFTLIGNDSVMFNSLTLSIEDHEVNVPGSAWSDPLLWKLHEDWFASLKAFSVSGAARLNVVA